MAVDGWREQLAVPGIRASIGPDGHGALHLLVMQSDLGSTARVRREGAWSEPRALAGHYFVGPIVPAPDGPRVVLVPEDVEGAWHLGAPEAWQPEPAWAAGGPQSVEPAVALDEEGAALFWLEEGQRPVVANRDGTRWEPERVHGTSALGLEDGAPRLVTELAAGVSVLAPTGNAVELARNHLTATDPCAEGSRCEMAWECRALRARGWRLCWRCAPWRRPGRRLRRAWPRRNASWCRRDRCPQRLEHASWAPQGREASRTTPATISSTPPT